MGWQSEMEAVQEAVVSEFADDELIVVFPVDDRWTPVEVPGVFDAESTLTLIGDAGDVTYSSQGPVLGLRDSDHQAKRGDEVEVRGRRYRAVDVRPDGQGMSVMVLEAV